MVHTTVASTACSTCHEKGLSWVGVPATLLRPRYVRVASVTLRTV